MHVSGELQGTHVSVAAQQGMYFGQTSNPHQGTPSPHHQSGFYFIHCKIFKNIHSSSNTNLLLTLQLPEMEIRTQCHSPKQSTSPSKPFGNDKHKQRPHLL